MPTPNQPRAGGNRPPSVIAAQPAAPQEEPAPSVVAAVPPVSVPSPEPITSTFERQGAFDLSDARDALQQLAQTQQKDAPPAARYIATVRHFMGGERGYIEPGEPIDPSATDLPTMLAQGTIREV